MCEGDDLETGKPDEGVLEDPWRHEMVRSEQQGTITASRQGRLLIIAGSDLAVGSSTSEPFPLTATLDGTSVSVKVTQAANRDLATQ